MIAVCAHNDAHLPRAKQCEGSNTSGITQCLNRQHNARSQRGGLCEALSSRARTHVHTQAHTHSISLARWSRTVRANPSREAGRTSVYALPGTSSIVLLLRITSSSPPLAPLAPRSWHPSSSLPNTQTPVQGRATVLYWPTIGSVAVVPLSGCNCQKLHRLLDNVTMSGKAALIPFALCCADPRPSSPVHIQMSMQNLSAHIPPPTLSPRPPIAFQLAPPPRSLPPPIAPIPAGKSPHFHVLAMLLAACSCRLLLILLRSISRPAGLRVSFVRCHKLSSYTPPTPTTYTHHNTYALHALALAHKPPPLPLPHPLPHDRLRTVSSGSHRIVT